MDKESNTMLMQILKSFNPWARTFGDYNVDKIPFRFSDNDETNKLIINSIFAGGGALVGTSLLTALASKIHAKKWEKKNEKIVKDKVNSLYTISAPNYEEDPTTTEDVRNIGLGSLLKKASGTTEDLGLVSQIWDTAKKGFRSTLPVTAFLTGAVVGPYLVRDRIKDKDKEELDEEITQKRNELAALHAKLIDLHLNKNASNKEEKPNVAAHGIGYASGAILTALFPVVFLATKAYLEKNDKNNKIVEAGESNAARNLTNIPQRVSLKLNSEGKPARSEKEQAYVKELKALANAADDAKKEKETKLLETPPTEDFDDKLTYIKKDALFS